jgi:hypothetical protein
VHCRSRTSVGKPSGTRSWQIIPRHGLVLSALLLTLGGCGNAHEHLSVGEWREVGKAEAPISRHKGEFVVTTEREGDGPVVAAGDLVQARLLVTTPILYGADYVGRREPQVIWVWTGREPEVSSEALLADMYTFGFLGRARPRIALIGRRLHERFEIHLEPGAESSTDDIPVRAIIEMPDAKLSIGGKIGGQRAVPLDWPGLQLTDVGLGSSSARIEILQICHARLYRRSGILTQRGIVPTSGDVKYRNERKGMLGWTAVDAQCPPPQGHVRFQAGPFYYFRSRDPDLLADWSSSYLRLRPPDQHPEEWTLVEESPQEKIVERMAPLRRQIADLENQQRMAESSCQLLKECEDPHKSAARKQEIESLSSSATPQLQQLECELEKKCEESSSER